MDNVHEQVTQRAEAGRLPGPGRDAGTPGISAPHVVVRCHVTPDRGAKMRKTDEAQSCEQVWTWEPV